MDDCGISRLVDAILLLVDVDLSHAADADSDFPKGREERVAGRKCRLCDLPNKSGRRIRSPVQVLLAIVLGQS